MPDKDNVCRLVKGKAREYCERKPGGNGGGNDLPSGGDGLTDGASNHVKGLADYLIDRIQGLLAPEGNWALKEADGWVYQQFLWLGQHLAVAIFICVVVVCALTAWQGAPRLKQMGASTGWTLAAVAGMASVPGAVQLLSQATSSAFRTMFDSNESTLFAVIKTDMDRGADAGNPLAILIITAALVVALAFATLVFMTRTLGVIVFICMAPLVLASLARGGDMSAVKTWGLRLLGLMFAPFALILVTPFVALVQGSLVMDAVLLVIADVIMLRMIFHGVPYFGPKIARATRRLVENRTTNPLALAVVRAGSPNYYEHENVPRGPRTLPTAGRAVSQDRGVLLAAYGLKPKPRPAQLTAESAVDKVQREAPRAQHLIEARRQARAAAAQTNTPGPAGTGRPANGTPNTTTTTPRTP
ncbi:hypothetical protein ACIA98_42415 [Streptomyces sp. NPDC051366]|uniref:hypothetical protein n=1 Tax=Streptomyces sp. NPDC051366 TaxID=3365652 RepID=UPI003797F9AD